MARMRVHAAVLALLFALASAGCGSSHGPGDGGGGRDGGGTDGGGTDAGHDGGGIDAGDGVRACEVPSDCIVVPESCCGSCGAATRGDAIALAADRADDYRTSVCEGMGCPACFMQQDPTLLATCNAGVCEVVDLHEHPSAACDSDDECRVRTRDCCECGGDTSRAGLVAIRADGEGDFTSVVCDPMIGCPECAPVYPEEASAVCNPDGYCEVEWADGG
ncbi:MAG: hypothetical protein ACOCUS_04965 [Polyangiales bacterium]